VARVARPSRLHFRTEGRSEDTKLILSQPNTENEHSFVTIFFFNFQRARATRALKNAR